VGNVLGVDVAQRKIEFESNEGNPLGQQLWQVSFDGERKQLSVGPGTHEGNVAPGGFAFVDRKSARMEPRRCDCARRRKCNVFWTGPSLNEYQLQTPQQLEVKAHDGETLYATLLLPAGVASAASVPLIVNPYGDRGR